MARIVDYTPYEVEAGTVECASTYTLDISRGDTLHAVEYPCNVWEWFEFAFGGLDWNGVVTWECPECGHINEFEIGD